MMIIKFHNNPVIDARGAAINLVIWSNIVSKIHNGQPIANLFLLPKLGPVAPPSQELFVLPDGVSPGTEVELYMEALLWVDRLEKSRVITIMKITIIASELTDLGWVFVEHDDNLREVVQLRYWADIVHGSRPLFILAGLEMMMVKETMMIGDFINYDDDDDDNDNDSHIAEISISEGSEERVDVALTCEVQPRLHVPLWGGHPFWVPAKVKVHNVYPSIHTSVHPQSQVWLMERWFSITSLPAPSLSLSSSSSPPPPSSS